MKLPAACAGGASTGAAYSVSVHPAGAPAGAGAATASSYAPAPAAPAPYSSSSSMMDLCSGTSGAGASVAPARTTVVPLPDIVSPSYAGGAGGDASGSIAEVVRADNADPKRVGEYIDAIMRHLCDLEVRARMLRCVGARELL